MRDLMVADREGARGDRVEHLGPVLLADRQEAGVAQRPVEVHRRVDGRDAVFGQHQDAQAFGLGGSDQVARGRIEVAQRLRHRRMGRVRPVALQVVVEVRQVDERQRRPVGADHVPRGLGDPPRRGDGRARTPELEQREGPELLRELVAQSRRLGVAVGELAPVGLVDRARRRADRRTPPAMLYHQNRLAQVKDGSRRLPASQIFSPSTSRFDCRQNQISIRSRNSQPLPTMPCWRGRSPVMKVACTLHVTAGVIVVERAHAAGRREPRQTGRVGAEVAGRQPDGQEDEGRAHRGPWRFARILPTRRAAVNADAACIVRRPERLTLRSLRAQHRLHREAMSLRRLMKQVAGNHRA